MADGFANEWLFRWQNPNLPKYVNEPKKPGKPKRRIVGYDGSGYPIYDNFQEAGDLGRRLRTAIAGPIDSTVEALRGWTDRNRSLQNKTPPFTAQAEVGQSAPAFVGPPVPDDLAQGPAASPPQGSGAPPASATAGAPAAPPATPPPNPEAMGRLSQAMVGPPEPMQGPPESPFSPGGGIFDTTDPAVLDQIIGLGDLERQLEFAQMLRDQKSPEGKSMYSRTGGQVYVAGSPLEHAAVALNKFRGRRAADRIGGEQIEGRKKILDILRKQ